MQGIVGQASDLEPSNCIMWLAVSFIFWSTDMACMVFDEERLRKQRRSTSNVTVRYFAWTQQPTHELDRRTSWDCTIWTRTTVEHVRACTSQTRTCLGGTHVGRNVSTRYRVGQGLCLPMKKDDEPWRKDLEELKQLLSSLQPAPGEWEIVCLKIEALSLLSCQWAAEEAYMTVCCKILWRCFVG